MDNREAIKTLEAEMKLLRWHKLANESALKAALLKAKQMKRREKVLRLQHGTNDWLNTVILDERSKDLTVRATYFSAPRFLT